jgi:TetR/AcrR family transcriptional repressor of multidrug resistance operon
MNERLFIFVPDMRTRDPQKEAVIREKALEMIVREGFDGFSMQKLAREANVSPGTLYIYFVNKEDLLDQLYNDVQQTYTKVNLQAFDPEHSFAEGLWQQWKNQLEFINEYPHHFKFLEQFRNSPLINNKSAELTRFRETMRAFVKNAFERGEISRMEPELYWSLAYGPFHALVKFHLNEKAIMDRHFDLTEEKLRNLHKMVIAALRS